MKAYRYNPETFIYEGEQERQLDPLTSAITGKEVYLMPANCTDINMTLESKEGYDIVFSNNDTWEYKEQDKKEEENKIPEYISTLEDKLSQLDAQYEVNKKTLTNYYMQFMINDDEEGMNSIKEELSELQSQYDKNRIILMNEESKEEQE